MTITDKLSGFANSRFWAILPSYLDGIIQHITWLAEGKDMPSEVKVSGKNALAKQLAIAQAIGQQLAHTSPKSSRIAVIPIVGPLANDPNMFFYGGTSYADIQDSVEEAMADQSINEIFLIVDSPGGNVAGLPETADRLFQARQHKPVTAIVTGMAASAAYYLASQANTITLTPSGAVGSVGVLVAHTDISKMLERAGINVTLLSAGEYKTEWYPFGPLSDEAKAAEQANIDGMYEQFIGAIVRGRGQRVKPEMTEEKFGKGRMLQSSAALAGGMVDRVMSIRDVLAGRAGMNRLALEVERLEVL